MQFNSPMEYEAYQFAKRRHGLQMYGEKPYMYHLEMVANRVRSYGETAVVLALLHDVVEDTNTSLHEVADRFGVNVAWCVDLLTYPRDLPRDQAKMFTYQRLSEISGVSGSAQVALVVKAADRWANVKSCLELADYKRFTVYKKESLEFKNACYRPLLCDDIWLDLSQMLAVYDYYCRSYLIGQKVLLHDSNFQEIHGVVVKREWDNGNLVITSRRENGKTYTGVL